MIGASPSVRVFAYTEPVDMRKGFDGLFGLVKTHLGREPLSGDLYVFVSRNRKRSKLRLENPRLRGQDVSPQTELTLLKE